MASAVISDVVHARVLQFFPELTQGQIDDMFIENPRRHFAGAAARFAARSHQE